MDGEKVLALPMQENYAEAETITVGIGDASIRNIEFLHERGLI